MSAVEISVDQAPAEVSDVEEGEPVVGGCHLGLDRWRAITGAHLVAVVRAGGRFENSALVERTEVAA